MKKTIGIYPSLNIPDYTSDQDEYFSFYLLRNLLRGIFLSVNYIVAGKKCLAEGLYAQSTMLFYSSAFHTLNAYLATNGIVLITPVSIAAQESMKEILIKVKFGLDKKKWTIEKFNAKHTKRWLLLEQLFKNKNVCIPDSFNNLFNSFYNPESHNRNINDPILKKYYKDVKPITFQNKLKEFLEMIAYKRHISIYESFGSTPEIVQDLINLDSLSDKGIDAHSIAFGKFASDFFGEVVDTTINEIISNLTLKPNSRKSLILSVYNPWFDIPKVKLLPIGQQERVKYIYTFLGFNNI